MIKKKILFYLIISLVLLVLFYKKNTIENFFLWNIPTRVRQPIYDIRGYPWLDNNFFYLHNGTIFNNNYIDTSKFNNLGLSIYDYMPYYSNGMIYNTDGSYKYDEFMKLYGNIPILYPISGDFIDWRGLINNGIIKVK